jgi:trimeric autotransporter adhesin
VRDVYRARAVTGAAILLTAGSVWVAANGAGRSGQQGVEPAGRQAPRCTVSGTVTAGGVARLPGVVVTATRPEAVAPSATSSALDGSYILDVPGPGRYQIKAELAAFAPFSRELVVESDCRAKVDIGLTLASRVQSAPAVQATRLQASMPGAAQTGGRGGFQRVAPVANGGAPNGVQPVQTLGTEDPDTIAAHLSLPPGFSADTLSQSVAAYGSSGQTNEMMLFGPGREGMFGGGREGTPGVPGAPMLPGEEGGSTTFGQSGLPGATLGPGGGREGGPGGFGGGRGMAGGAEGMGGGRGAGLGPGGMGGRGGGRGGPGEGPLAGRLGLGAQMANRPRGQASYTLGGSPFDASPYSLTGTPTTKPDYLQQRISASIGGPLKIPKLFDAGPRTTFFLNYAGNHSSNLYNQYSTVPTLAMREGDFSASSVPIIDPVTHQPFPGNQIPADRLDPASLALLAYIPTPNQEASKQNFYYSTTNQTSSDDINFRFIRSFGTTQQRRPGARGAAAGRGGGGGGGRGGGAMGGGYNLNIGVHYQHADSTQANPFPTIKGTTQRSGWDVPVSFSFPGWGGMLHSLRFDFNRSHSQTTNAFAYVEDVSGNAGITGISTDPFDWGLPNLSFSSISSLRDISPSLRDDQTLTFSDSIVKTKGRHSIRTGAEFRDLRLESRTDPTARGNYLFTGLYTGVGRVPFADFADFLLGFSQQASVQYGPGTEQLRSRSFATYLQDDWRVRSNFTINAGVRYEYQSPYSEASNRLVTLDVTPDFTAATPVQAGGVGPYSGQFPDTLVEPDRNNIAPRIGIAWRPKPNHMVRGGYSINYASVPYLSVAQRLASQPPYAVTDTRLGSIAAPLLLTDAFGTPATDTTTNNYGVDRTYDIGYVHIWNVDFQRDFGRTMSIGASYIGTKGSQLDLQRAPNRDPTGLRIEGVQPFIWESSGARSLMNSLSLRISRRLAQGLSGSATYTLSKSMDDASSIGGGGAVVAQNDQNLAAEWGLSSFDQRHRFTGTFTWELPFGSNRKWLSGSTAAAHVFGGWILSGTFSAASGTPYTARVVNNVADVARGTTGTLRADYSGEPIVLSNPTIAEYFNTAAFSLPPAGRFGDSARNMIIGPGSGALSAGLMKNFQFAGTRGLAVRIQGTNILNQVQWSAIDTNLNSPTFGQVTSVRPMRSLQLILRVMY